MFRILLAGIAAVALAAGPGLAQGKGGGGGNERGGGHEQGGGNERGGKGHEGRSMQSAKPGKGDGESGNAEHGRGGKVGQARGPEMRGQGRSERREERRAQRLGDERMRGNGDRVVVEERRGVANVVRVDNEFRRRDIFAGKSRGLIAGCPPGLARKNNGCRPPGLARQQDAAWRTSLYRPEWWGLSGLATGPYYYDDGYLYQMNNGVVGGFVPLLGGALSVGNPWPSFYEPVPLPVYYQDYYGLDSPDRYRFADDVIYGYDPGDSEITSILGMLTGDNFAVGQPLPLGYDVYNVPYAYRDTYYDGPDSLYRYSDGYIYEVDPQTRLIETVIGLLT